MDRYVCITVLSNPGEAQADFAARLSRFWTLMLRSNQDDFEKVYAETTAFVEQGTLLSRQYLVEADAIDTLETELQAELIAFVPIDRDDLFSKYEAVSPEWMQIEH